MARACVALGSNLGDRRAHIAWAVDRLRDVLADLRVSTVVETPALDVPEPQPPYLNAVVIGDTDQTPEALLDVLLDLERQRGRVRSYRLAPRTLDLDLILYEGTVRDTMGLVLPHPRFRARRFVLAPLVELAPEWKDPVTGRTALELLEALDGEGGAKPPHPPV